MMRTILVLNAKGGCGKTTIATNLAGYYASQNEKVFLADLDPQSSSMDWLAARPPKLPAIKGVNAANRRFRIPADTDVLILDSPASTHDHSLRGVVRRADYIVLPVLPSPLDMRAAERFLAELLRVKRVLNAEVKITVVANRVREKTKAATALEDYLGDLKLPSGRKFPFVTMLRASQNYLRAAEQGMSVFEFAPFATLQDREEFLPLIRWLNR